MVTRETPGGHRDAIPESPAEVLRWARDLLIHMKQDEEFKNDPFDEIADIRDAYKQAKAWLAEYGPEPPPQPNPIDGLTIYWDKRLRFEELYCDFYGIPIDKNGFYNRKELFRRSSARERLEQSRQWKDYLMDYVRENADRYHMPPEWVEGVRRALDEAPLSPDGDSGGGMQQVLLILQSR